MFHVVESRGSQTMTPTVRSWKTLKGPSSVGHRLHSWSDSTMVPHTEVTPGALSPPKTPRASRVRQRPSLPEPSKHTLVPNRSPTLRSYPLARAGPAPGPSPRIAQRRAQEPAQVSLPTAAPSPGGPFLTRVVPFYGRFWQSKLSAVGKNFPPPLAAHRRVKIGDGDISFASRPEKKSRRRR